MRKEKIESILPIIILSILAVGMAFLLNLSNAKDEARNAKYDECLKVSNEVEYLKECMN